MKLKKPAVKEETLTIDSGSAAANHAIAAHLQISPGLETDFGSQVILSRLKSQILMCTMFLIINEAKKSQQSRKKLQALTLEVLLQIMP